MALSSHSISENYERDGYCFPFDAMTSNQAGQYRHQLESIEARARQENLNQTIWFTHANFVLPFVDEMTRLPAVLEPVKAILGPNLLVWNASFFIKEPNTPGFVSWHQDLTYWGLNGADEITAWIALSPATMRSGCMRFVPGSHTRDVVAHRDTFADANMLSRGQELAVDVHEEDAVEVELKPGQMSLHHGHIFHASGANRSGDRRIGLAIRYITPTMKQRAGEKTYAHLVAGEDSIGNFNLLDAPQAIMVREDVEASIRNIEIAEKFLYAGVKGRGKPLR